MDKLTAIKIKYDDNTYSEEIPIGISIENVDYDNTHNLLQVIGDVDLSAGSIQSQIDELLVDIASVRHAVGSPLVAATASAMTNVDKIYVYTGSETGYVNGNWYYYDGTNWTSGGIYNSVAVETDVNLVTPGMAADAKATGDVFSELNNALDVTEITDTMLSSSDLENGALDANGMNAGSMNYRIRTSNYIELPENSDAYVNVVSDENVYFTVWYFTVNDFTTSKIRMEDWRKSGKLNVPSNAKYVRFVFSINKSTNLISPSDIDSVTISYIESALDYVVKVTQQTLTDEQKAQARANIGAISDEEGLLANFTINNGYICQIGGA